MAFEREGYMTTLFATLSQQFVSKLNLQTRPCSTFVSMANKPQTELKMQARTSLALIGPDASQNAFGDGRRGWSPPFGCVMTISI